MRCPDAGVFSSFVSGALDESARGQLELHVDTCESCRILLSETCRGVVGAPSRAALPVPGDKVGRYTIVDDLGAGAMGVVYLAWDPELDRELAIKLVQPQPGSAEDELVQQRMLREGRALARIDHPNVVRVFDVGRWQGALFVAMERVRGCSLREWLARPRTPAEIVDVFARCADGLAAAHDAGVVHRDVKPENVIVDELGRPRVTDFGLAITDAVPHDDIRTAPTGPIAVTAVQLTRTDGIVGTPAYMAPEQHRGGADGRSDQFALCIALVEALTGERPFTAETLEERRAPIARGVDLPVPHWLRRVLARGLAVDPEARYPSMSAFARALRRRPRWPRAAAAAAAIVVASGLVLWQRGGDACDGATASFDRAWHGDRIERIAAAFASSGKPFAAPAWEYTRSVVDRYATDWRKQRVAACRAEQTAVVRCLERRAIELDAVLARWEQGTIETLAAAPYAADALGAPEACQHPELDPLPAKPTERARLAAIEKRFYAAQADDLAGNAVAASAAMQALLPELETLPVLRAEALYTLAATQRELGRPKQAREHLVAAIATAEAAGATRTKARAWMSLAELADEAAVRPEDARDALRFSDAVLAQLGHPESLALEREVAVGLVALRAGEHAAAIEALRASLAGKRPLEPAERTRRLQILARALIAAGKIEDALVELERAEQLIASALGPESPHLIPVLNSQVEPLDYLGRQSEAIARGERALRISDASLGKDAPRRAALLNNLAVVYGNMENLPRAIALSEEVLATKLRAYGEDSHDVAIARQNLASTLTDAKRPADALPHLDRALKIFTKTVGAEHPLVANVHSALVTAHTQLGHPHEALAHAERALAIREAAEVGAGYLAYSRFQVAQALRAAGRRADAIAMARRALELPLASTGREGELAEALRAFIAQR